VVDHARIRGRTAGHYGFIFTDDVVNFDGVRDDVRGADESAAKPEDEHWAEPAVIAV